MRHRKWRGKQYPALCRPTPEHAPKISLQSPLIPIWVYAYYTHMGISCQAGNKLYLSEAGAPCPLTERPFSQYNRRVFNSFAAVQAEPACRCSSMAELQPSKLATRVRFPSSAPRRNELRSFRFFDFIKNQSSVPLFLLFRKKSRCVYAVRL